MLDTGTQVISHKALPRLLDLKIVKKD